MSRAGQCLCGAVRFVAADVEPTFHACHCSMCRRWCGGSPFFGVSAKAFDHPPEAPVRRFASSDWAERGSCATCGSALFYYLKPTGTYSVSIGVLDDASDLTLDEEIYVDHKPESYALAGERPRLTEAEILARFGAG